MLHKLSSQLSSSTQAISRLFSTISYKLPKCETFKFKNSLIPTKIEMEKDEAMKIYRTMALIRRCEIECDIIYKTRAIRGFLHLYDGQEAVLGGMESELTWEDPMITTYRNHGQVITRGDSAYQLLAEMLAKGDGSVKGKGGSMHYFRKKSHYYGGNGVVGSHIPVGTGLAFALKYLNKKNVAVTMFGDGAINQGQFFESSNMAALWKLPVLYIVENNIYAMGTACHRASANTKLYQRGEANNIPGIKADGQDVFLVKALTKMAKKWVIENGPLMIEFDTYRYHGHSMSDPGLSYRSREEVAKVRKDRDPISKMQKVLLKQKNCHRKRIKRYW